MGQKRTMGKTGSNWVILPMEGRRGSLQESIFTLSSPLCRWLLRWHARCVTRCALATGERLLRSLRASLCVRRHGLVTGWGNKRQKKKAKKWGKMKRAKMAKLAKTCSERTHGGGAHTWRSSHSRREAPPKGELLTGQLKKDETKVRKKKKKGKRASCAQSSCEISVKERWDEKKRKKREKT